MTWNSQPFVGKGVADQAHWDSTTGWFKDEGSVNQSFTLIISTFVIFWIWIILFQVALL